MAARARVCDAMRAALCEEEKYVSAVCLAGTNRCFVMPTIGIGPPGKEARAEEARCGGNARENPMSGSASGTGLEAACAHLVVSRTLHALTAAAASS